MNNQLMFSSKNQAWDTPQEFFDKQNARFGFTLDVAASIESAKCEKYFTESDNGLEQKWSGRCWMNSPYGRPLGTWVKKAWSEAADGNAMIVGLMPARTDTLFFHNYIYRKKNVEVEFLKGRLIFGSDAYWQWVWEQEIINGKLNTLYGKIGKKNPAPFPSMLVIFNPIKL